MRILLFKCILVLCFTLLYIQASFAINSYDSSKYDHIADYVIDKVENSVILQSSMNPQERLNFKRGLNRWKSYEYKIISSHTHDLGLNQFAEVFLIRLGETYYIIALQLHKQEETELLYNMTTTKVSDEIINLQRLLNSFLPDFEIDKEESDHIKSLIKESGDTGTLKPLTSFNYSQILIGMDIPQIIKDIGITEDETDNDIFSYLTFHGNVKLLSSKMLTKDISFLVFYQESTYGPTVYVLTLLHTDNNFYLLHFHLIAGAEAIPMIAVTK